MKKIITITTLLAAGTLLASAETITLPESSDFTWVNGDSTGFGDNRQCVMSGDVLSALIGKIPAGTDLVGWFGGVGQNKSQSEYNDITISSSTGFSFKSRPALSGEYVMFGVDLTESAQSITLSFTSDNQVSYSLWAYDETSSSVTQLIGDTFEASAGTFSGTYDTAKISPSKIFAVWLENSKSSTVTELAGNTLVSISNISLSYTPVPEPSAFGLLAGLGALALAGTRRRRRK